MMDHIAYFSAEYGLSADLPIYAGGLGVLAGDFLKQANSRFPLVGVGLWYHEGFFRQKIDQEGNQIEEDIKTDPRQVGLEEVLDPSNGRPLTVEVEFPPEPAEAKVWQKKIGDIPLYLLDAQIPVNEPWEQEYTAHLYPSSEISAHPQKGVGQDERWSSRQSSLRFGGRDLQELYKEEDGGWSPRLAQEILLGVGGVRLIRKLGLPVRLWHINDDHAAFSILERLREELNKGQPLVEAVAKVKNETVFTTHTPVAGAESRFEPEFIWPYLKILFKDLPVSKEELLNLGGLDLKDQNDFSFSVLALRMSSRINAVSKRHQQVAKKAWHSVFPSRSEDEVPVYSITNGVNAKRWTAAAMDTFYQKYLGGDYQNKIDQSQVWQSLKGQEIRSDLWQARLQCKRLLIKKIDKELANQASGEELATSTPYTLDPELLFICFARRFAAYKRPTLILHDLKRLKKILLDPSRPVYLVFAGKAHPADAVGQQLLKQVIEISRDPSFEGHVRFLPNYNIDLAKLLVGGVDVWLNNPLPPWEASGTSGMKAVLNGVLNLSVADGWWWEKGSDKVGWTIGAQNPDLENLPSDEALANDLYEILEKEVIPLYYGRNKEDLPVDWLKKIVTSLQVLSPFVSTQRMLKDYIERLYHPTSV